MTTTRDNPTGVADYDLANFARLPEWQQLAQALNRVALAANREGLRGGQNALVTAVGHLARGVAFMDCCPTCDSIVDNIWVDTSAAPYATTVSSDGVDGRYRCARGHEWTCWYSLLTCCWLQP